MIAAFREFYAWCYANGLRPNDYSIKIIARTPQKEDLLLEVLREEAQRNVVDGIRVTKPGVSTGTFYCIPFTILTRGKE